MCGSYDPDREPLIIDKDSEFNSEFNSGFNSEFNDKASEIAAKELCSSIGR